MRHCFGEEPLVFEATGTDFAALVQDTALTAADYNEGWFNLTVNQVDDVYTITLYVHK